MPKFAVMLQWSGFSWVDVEAAHHTAAIDKALANAHEVELPDMDVEVGDVVEVENAQEEEED